MPVSSIEMMPLMAFGSTLSSIAPTLIGGASLAAVIANFESIFPRVPSESRGLRSRGKNQIRMRDSITGRYKAGETYSRQAVKPGTHFAVPYFRGVTCISLQNQRTDLDVVSAQHGSTIIQAKATLGWHVVKDYENGKDISDSYGMPYTQMLYNAINRNEKTSGGLQGEVNKVASGTLRNVLVKVGKSAIDMTQQEIYNLLRVTPPNEESNVSCEETLLYECGVQMTKLMVHDVTQTEGSLRAEALGHIAKSVEDLNEEIHSMREGNFASGLSNLIRSYLSGIVSAEEDVA